MIAQGQASNGVWRRKKLWIAKQHQATGYVSDFFANMCCFEAINR